MFESGAVSMCLIAFFPRRGRRDDQQKFETNYNNKSNPMLVMVSHGIIALLNIIFSVWKTNFKYEKLHWKMQVKVKEKCTVCKTYVPTVLNGTGAVLKIP